MELWLSAEIQQDVSEDHRQISNQIEGIVNSRLASDYGPGVVEWALITILRPQIPEGWGEVWRYHRARNVVEFRLIINHKEFKRAPRPKQRSMLLASIFRSMDIFPLLKVKNFDLDRFRRDVQEIAISEGWISAGEDLTSRTAATITPPPVPASQPNPGPTPMSTLYLRDGSHISKYHEAWPHGPHIIEHWGDLGSRGNRRRHLKRPNEDEDTAIRRILQPAIEGGYAPIPSRDHVLLLVEYAVEGFGTEADLKKRYALQDRLNETLGWTGLGKVDGGSIGSGTMEVACVVVDPEIAIRIIKDDLASTPFADYSRILVHRETDE